MDGVSVIIPLFNGRDCVGQAIESVLQQARDDLQIIVVDDGSTDDSGVVAARYPVELIRQDNQGPAAARMRGLGLASREFIAFIDADDLWPSGKLAVQMQHFRSTPGLDAVLGRYQLWRIDETPQGRIASKVGQPQPAFNLGAGVYRRSLFERLGGLASDAVPSEDVDWYLRMREAQAQIREIDDVVLHYRLHGSNLTKDRQKALSAIASVIGRSLARRRHRPLKPVADPKS